MEIKTPTINISPSKIRIATFNVSMEAINYATRESKEKLNFTGNELTQALRNDHQQIKNIAEIIQYINPDIILLNEFDRVDNNHKNIHYFIEKYLNIGQNKQIGIHYPFFYQGTVNTGLTIKTDKNHVGLLKKRPIETHGFGFFEGHYGMALLSKYPIMTDEIRTFQKFKWKDMPNALQPIDPVNNKPWYSDEIWKQLRLSSKSHWDIPINVNETILHVLASHPTPPVFDGLENRNGKRNNDEIRFWVDYISEDKANYIYDDNDKKGGLSPQQSFVILGDLNASNVEGDAINKGINNLINHEKLIDPKPSSKGGELHNSDNKYAKFHTASWGMRADYVLPSKLNFTIKNSGVFWPHKNDEKYHLIENRQASSDHRLVWVDLVLNN